MPDVREAQAEQSADVKMTPESPTATKSACSMPMARKVAPPEIVPVAQVVPFVDVT